MSSATRSFETPEPALGDILSDVKKGDLQLPDFQRDWIWSDDQIKSLIASVTQSFPIGAIMVLENTDGESGFLTRSVQGASYPKGTVPTELILDGQQRITSLFMAMISKDPVPTRNDKQQDVKRYYYLDMKKCLDPMEDREDAVISVPPERKIKFDFGRQVELDISSAKLEYEQCLFPVNIIYDLPAVSTWKIAFQKHYNYDESKIQFLNDFEQKIWLPLQQYKLPEIKLLKDTPREAVCLVFEKVNTGGVPLSVFELMTATFARDKFRLRDDWKKRGLILHDKKVLSGFDETAFLTAVTLLTKYQSFKAGKGAVSCRRKDVLKLKLEDYKSNADLIEKGLMKAAKLLTRERIYDARSLPYATQLIPLSAICACLDKRFENDAVKQKLARWFWCGVFGELYGGANETRYAQDIQDVVSWIEGDLDEPRTIAASSFSTTRLLSLNTRLSAAYKGFMAQMMKAGNTDFISGDSIDVNNFFEQAIDIHHIFPKAYCEKHPSIAKRRDKWNSIINKAPLSAETNRKLGGRAPSQYLKSITDKEELTVKKVDEFLGSHLINPELLRSDSFDEFIIDRAARLLDLVETATGKPVSDRDSDEVKEKFGSQVRLSEEQSVEGRG